MMNKAKPWGTYEEVFRTCYESSPLGITILDTESHRFLKANKSFCSIVGYSEEELTGLSVRDLTPPEDWEHEKEMISMFQERNLPHFKLERRYIRKDGEIKWVRVNGEFLKGMKGAPSTVLAMVEDITEAKRTEEALRESEKRFRKILNELPQYISYTDRDLIYRMANRTYLENFGLKLHQILGKPLREVIGEKAFEKARPHIEDVLQGRRVHYKEFYEYSTGSPRHMEGVLIPDMDPNGNVYGYYAVLTDTTSHLETQEALRKAALDLQAAVTAGNIGLWDWDLETNTVHFSPEWKRQIGYADHELKDDFAEWQSRLHPDDLDQTLHKVWSSIEAGLPSYQLEFRFRHKDGSYRWILAQASVIKDRTGRPVRTLGSHVDITDRKRSEEALRALAESEMDPSESVFQFLVHKIAVSTGFRCAMLVRVGPEDPGTARTMAVWDGEAFMENFSYPLEGTPCGNVLDRKSFFFPKGVRKDFPKAELLADMGVESYWGAPLTDNRGEVFGVLAVLHDSPVEYHPHVHSLLQSFAARATAELKRQDAEAERERLIMAIEQASETIVITDAEGNIQFVNPAFETTTGYSAEEARGQNPRILKSGVQDESFYRTLWQTVTAGRTWRGRMVNRRKDGSLYTEEASISPVGGGKDQVTNFVAVKRDITSEIDMENRLTQAQKMEAIGTLAGGIAHDFNNILSAIVGFAQLVEEELPEGSQNRADLGEVLKAAGRAKGLVKQILAFSRQGDHQARPLRVDLIAKEALKMLRASLPASMEISHSMDPELPHVVADPTQVHQVLLNLCTNAAQAMEDESGVLEVRLDAVKLEKELLTLAGHLPPGEYVRLRVGDTGVGIPEDVMGRVFEPYFTTKKAGEGTGLGLAVVYGIVKDSGGGILVESASGKGTIFTVYFPGSVGEPETVEPRQKHFPRGREQILFVDDEPPIVKLGKEYLERLGYDVTATQSPLDALDLFREAPDRFDLVITDMTMPRMTGDEFASAVLSVRPGIPVILCTGYSRRMSETKAREMGIRAFVMKPLAQDELAHTIRRVLDEDRPAPESEMKSY